MFVKKSIVFNANGTKMLCFLFRCSVYRFVWMFQDAWQ